MHDGGTDESDELPGEGFGEFEPRLGIFDDVVDEVRWTLTARRGWMLQILLNLLVGIPFVLSSHWGARHGSLRVDGFATSLAGWALASVLNTNQLGFDADRVRRSLARGDEAMRILFLKNIAIALVLAPITLGLTVILRVAVTHHPGSIPVALTKDVADFATWLGFGCALSVLLPFRPLGWRGRLRARSTWLYVGICVAAPYLIYYAIWPIWHLPEVAIADALFHRDARHHIRGYGITLLLWGTLSWLLGLSFAQLYSRRAAGRLDAALRGAR